MMRNGNDTPSSSQADSAYERHGMGKHQYQIQQNDGEDWDEVLPTAASQLTNYKHPAAHRRASTVPYKHSTAAAGKIRAITPATAANVSPGSPQQQRAGSHSHNPRGDQPRNGDRMHGDHSSSLSQGGRPESRGDARSAQHAQHGAAQYEGGREGNYHGGGSSGPISHISGGGAMSHTGGGMSSELSVPEDSDASGQGPRGYRSNASSGAAYARRANGRGGGSGTGPIAGGTAPQSRNMNAYSGAPVGSPMGSTDHLVEPRSRAPISGRGHAPPSGPMGTADHLIEPRSRSGMGAAGHRGGSSVPGAGARTAAGSVGATDHLVAPRRSPIGRRRATAAMNYSQPAQGFEEPINLAPTPASARSIPVLPGDRRGAQKQSRSGSVGPAGHSRASAPVDTGWGEPRASTRAQRSQQEGHLDEQREITAARRIPGAQGSGNSDDISGGRGRRGGGGREGSAVKPQAGSVPLGAYLSALNKKESKETSGREYSSTATIVLENQSAQSAPVNPPTSNLYIPDEDPTPVRSKIVPDSKLAARKAAKGQNGSLPLGNFLNALSKHEHSKRHQEGEEEEILPAALAPFQRGRGRAPASSAAATAPLRGAVQQQQQAPVPSHRRGNSGKPAASQPTGGHDHALTGHNARARSPLRGVNRTGDNGEDGLSHIVPRHQSSRSASCGPPPMMSFDPAAAASIAIGDDQDGEYIPALASNKKAHQKNKLSTSNQSQTSGGALSGPLHTANNPKSPWSGLAPGGALGGNMQDSCSFNNELDLQPPSSVIRGGAGGGLGGLGGGRSRMKGSDSERDFVPTMNALSAPARGSTLAKFAARSSEDGTDRHEESIPEEASDRERDDYVNSSIRGKMQPGAATFVLQDPSEQDTAGLRAYSGRNQMDVAAKRAMVDLRLDAPSGQDPMGPHPAEQALAQNLKQPGPHARNVQAASAQMWATDRDATSHLGSVLPSQAPIDDHECFNSMQDIDGSEIESVEELCERLSCGRKVKTVNLAGHTVLQPSPAAPVTSSPWRKVALWPVQGEVSSTAINNGLFSLVRSGPRDALYCTTGSGAKVTTGNIALRSHSCIVLDDTCSGMLLSNLTIRDGVVLCHGKGCQVTFTNVTFERCTLVVLQGAAATLHSCHFANSSRQEGVSIFASGGGTSVNLRGGTITGGAQGVTITGGAAFKAAFLTVTKVSVTGLEVRDAGSMLTLSACTISDFPSVHCEAAGVRGVLVLSHASAELHGLTVRAVESGIVVGMASANILNCDVSGTLESCVAFRAGATGKVENCVLSGSLQRHGLYASGGGTTVEAQNCRFVGNKEMGVAANHGGHVVVNLCETQRNQRGGIMVLRNASVKATDCTSCDDHVGLGACEGSQVVGEHVTVQSSTSACYSILCGSSAKLQDCVAADGKDIGFWIDGKSTVANLVRCEVRTCAQTGVKICDRAVATLERVLVEGSKRGDGVRVQGEGSNMQAKECRILRCQMYGVLACKGGAAELTQCETKQNKVAGFSCEDEGSQLTLAACASDFDAQGCGAGTGGKLQARNVAVCDSQRCGFRIWRGGEATLEACKVTKCGDTGVLATDPGSMLIMAECAVTEGLHACVSLGRGAKGDLRGCVLSSSGLDGVAAYGESTEVDARNCKMMENEQCGALVSGKAKMRLQGCQSTCNRSDGFCAESGASLKLARCTSDSDRCGCVGTGAVMELEEVAATRSVACGFVFREATSAIMKECTAMACGTNGVEVGSEAQVAIEGGAVRGNYELGVVVGMGSRSVLKGVRSSENGMCGFKCTLSGKLLLVGCESGDSTPYLRSQGGSMQCQGCDPEMGAAEGAGVGQEMTSDMVDDMLGDMLGAFQALLNDPPPDLSKDVM